MITDVRIMCTSGRKATPFRVNLPASPYNDLTITITSKETDIYID